MALDLENETILASGRDSQECLYFSDLSLRRERAAEALRVATLRRLVHAVEVARCGHVLVHKPTPLVQRNQEKIIVMIHDVMFV